MLRFIFVAAVLTLTACGQSQAPQSSDVGTAGATGSSSGSSGSASSASSSSSSSGSSGTSGSVTDGGPVDAGPDCFIAGEGYNAGDRNPNDSCKACDASSPSAWTTLSTGTACGTGVCVNGLCQSGCLISGMFYQPGAVNPANSCETCDTARSTSQWSSSEGQTCGTNEICHNSTCVSGCFFDGGFYAPGESDNGCRACNPAQDTSHLAAYGTDPVNSALDGGDCDGAGSFCTLGTCYSNCLTDADCPYRLAYCDPSSNRCMVGCPSNQWCQDVEFNTAYLCVGEADGGTHCEDVCQSQCSASQTCNPTTHQCT